MGMSHPFAVQVTGNPVVWEEYKKEFLDPLPDPEVLDRDPTEEEIEDMVELIYHRMYMRGVKFFPLDGTTRHVKKSKRKTKKSTWGNELNGQLPLMGPDGPGSKKVGEQWPPIWRDELCGNQPVSWDVGAKLQNSLARSNRSRIG